MVWRSNNREKRKKMRISAVKVWELTASSCIFNLRTRSESQNRYFSLCSSPEAAGEANSYKKHLLQACFVALWDAEQSLFAGSTPALCLRQSVFRWLEAKWWGSRKITVLSFYCCFYSHLIIYKHIFKPKDTSFILQNIYCYNQI